jgi:protein tyrosine/serine phosphatase
MMKTNWIAAACAVVPLVGAACSHFSSSQPRPGEWAQPVALEGVPNLYRVTATVYRSAQPTPAGMKNLMALGIRTVVDLRAGLFHSDTNELRGTTLLNEELSVHAWHMEDEDVVRTLRVLRSPDGGPYLVHCLQGADRTGTMIAMYRMVIQAWPREQAIEEMVNGGYGFHAYWTNILSYLRQVDVERIRARVESG